MMVVRPSPANNLDSSACAFSLVSCCTYRTFPRMTLWFTSAIWYCILGTSPALRYISILSNGLTDFPATHIYPSDQPDKHRVETSNRRRDPLAHRVLLARNRLASMVPAQRETLAFAEADVLPTRML